MNRKLVFYYFLFFLLFSFLFIALQMYFLSMQMQCNCIKIAILRPCEALFIFTSSLTFPTLFREKSKKKSCFCHCTFALHLHCICIAFGLQKHFHKAFRGLLTFTFCDWTFPEMSNTALSESSKSTKIVKPHPLDSLQARIPVSGVNLNCPVLIVPSLSQEKDSSLPNVNVSRMVAGT